MGIIFSGLLDDGTSGMKSRQRNGITTIVQDLLEAIFPAMPKNELQCVDVDHVLLASAIGGMLTKLFGQRVPKHTQRSKDEIVSR